MRLPPNLWLKTTGLLLLTSQVAVAIPPVPSPRSGGIPAACYVAQLPQMPSLQMRRGLVDERLRRYQLTQDLEGMRQLANALDSREFPGDRVAAFLWLAEQALQRADRVQAQAFLTQALEGTRRLPEPEQQVRQLQRLGWLLVAAAQPDQAAIAFAQSVRIAQRIPKAAKEQIISVLADAAAGYNAIGQPRQAIALLNQGDVMVRSLPDQGNFHHKAISLATLSYQYALLGEVERANRLFTQAVELVAAAEGVSDGTQALSWLYQVTLDLPQSEVLKGLSVAQIAQLDDIKQTHRQQLIAQQLKLARTPQLDRRDRQMLYSQLAYMWVMADQVQTGMEFATTLPEARDQFVLMYVLMDVLGKSGKPEQALTLIPQVQKAAQAIQDPQKRAEMLRPVAATYVELGQPGPALELLKDTTDPTQKQWLTAAIADAFLKVKQPDEAARLLNSLPLTNNLPSDALEFLWEETIKALAGAGQFDRALALTQRVPLMSQRDSLIAIARELVKVGDVKRAIAILQPLKRQDDRKLAFQLLSQQAISQENWDQAQMLLQLLPENTVYPYFWSQLAIGYAEAQQYDRALQAAQVIHDDELKQLITCAQGVNQPKRP